MNTLIIAICLAGISAVLLLAGTIDPEARQALAMGQVLIIAAGLSVAVQILRQMFPRKEKNGRAKREN